MELHIDGKQLYQTLGGGGKQMKINMLFLLLLFSSILNIQCGVVEMIYFPYLIMARLFVGPAKTSQIFC